MFNCTIDLLFESRICDHMQQQTLALLAWTKFISQTSVHKGKFF